MYYSDYLCHHGVANQKWGVRHGPPYPIVRDKLGRARKVVSDGTKKAKEKLGSAENKVHSSTIVPKRVKQYLRVSEMSNQELKARIDRLKLEKEYKTLLRVGEKKISKGREVLWDIFKTTGTTLAANLIKSAFDSDKGDKDKDDQDTPPPPPKPSDPTQQNPAQNDYPVASVIARRISPNILAGPPRPSGYIGDSSYIEFDIDDPRYSIH